MPGRPRSVLAGALLLFGRACVASAAPLRSSERAATLERQVVCAFEASTLGCHWRLEDAPRPVTQPGTKRVLAARALRGAALLAAWELAARPLARVLERSAPDSGALPRQADAEEEESRFEGLEDAAGDGAEAAAATSQEQGDELTHRYPREVLWAAGAAAAAGLAMGLAASRRMVVSSAASPVGGEWATSQLSEEDREKLRRFHEKLQGAVLELRKVRSHNFELEETRSRLRVQMANAFSKRLEYLDALRGGTPRGTPTKARKSPEKFDISDPMSLAPVCTPPPTSRAAEGNFFIGEKGAGMTPQVSWATTELGSAPRAATPQVVSSASSTLRAVTPVPDDATASAASDTPPPQAIS